MTDTPIYDGLVEEAHKRKAMESSIEKFIDLSNLYPSESFDISERDYRKLKDSLIHALYESFARSQEIIYSTVKTDRARLFNAGMFHAVALLKEILGFPDIDNGTHPF